MLAFLSGFKNIAGAIALGIVVALIVVGLVVIEKNGEAAGRAELQPKLDAATQALGDLTSANAAQAKTIAQLRANEALNDALTQQLNAKLAASAQQAADVSATIRKLQANDQTVADFLLTPIPEPLRGVLNDGGPVAVPDSGSN